jgi:hypothetical protein
MNKEDILKKVSIHLENNIKEITNSLENYEAGSNIDEGDTIDPEDFSQQSEQRNLQYQMQIQLDQAESGLSRLKEFEGKQFSVARSGALVETDKNWILMGISVPALQVDDKELLGISPESPAYQILNGKSKGDSFKLGNNNYTITGIY